VRRGYLRSPEFRQCGRVRACDRPGTHGHHRQRRAGRATTAGPRPRVQRPLAGPPGALSPSGPDRAESRGSRWQLRLRTAAADELEVEAIGRGELRVNGRSVGGASVRPGDLIEVVDRFLLLVSERPMTWPRGEPWAHPFAYAAADPFGVVGESPAAWDLRHKLVFLGTVAGHVLVEGPSGAGKELAVRAIHACSERAARPMIARNAATIPEGLIDAELFGNLKNYPNPGTPDRPGLLGEADGSSLFLDEIGELSHALQARLLRVMDSGEYQRLGEARTRMTQVRVLAATNRDPDELKHDLLARFPHRLRVPGLERRPEDVALLVRHLVRGFAASSPERVERFVEHGEPRVSARLIYALTRRAYKTQTRELGELLWRAIGASPGAVIDAPAELITPAAPAPGLVDPKDLSREHIAATLARCGGVRDRAWRELNLRNRDQLKRLLKKHHID
jgi:transcriptional regulator with GAF, ATPase, and Fis domain